MIVHKIAGFVPMTIVIGSIVMHDINLPALIGSFKFPVLLLFRVHVPVGNQPNLGVN